MEESRVRELIKEAVSVNGAVTEVIQSAIAGSLGELGAVKVHVQAAIGSLLEGPVQDAIAKAQSEIEFNTRGDQ